MKYLIALVVGYYVLEAVRHFVRQLSRWSEEETALHIGYKSMLCVVILLTCLFWPIMYIRAQVKGGA